MEAKMPKVRPNVGQKWGQVTAQRTDYYTQGVNNPRRDWAQAAQAGAANQAAAIQKAIQEKRYEKGVQKAGSAKWLKGAVDKGTVRFAQGVQAGQGDYEQGIQPYLQTIEATQLPPRYPKGDPRNIERVKVIAEALRKKKMGS